jgi:antirestriction protein ArdC
VAGPPREDHRAIVRAASAASKAADYLLAFRDRLPAPARPENGAPAPAENVA